MVAATRIGFLGPVVGRDGRYVAELVPVAALVVGLILLGPRPELPGDVRPGQFRDDAVRTAAVDGPRHLPWLIGAVVLGYVTSAGITTHAAALDRHHSLAQRWVATARDDLRRDPRAVVVDAPVPAQVLAPLFGVDARASRVLSAFGVPASRFNRTTDRLVVLDADGRLAPAQLIASARSGKGPEPGCGWRVDGRRRLPTGDALVASDWIVRVGYYAAAPNSLARLDVGGGEFTVSFPAGLGYVYVFPSGPVDGAELSGIGSDLPICVTDVAVGRAWPARP